MKSWFEDCLKRLKVVAGPRRHPIQIKQWDSLIRFLDEGRIEIGSNSVERSMRPIVLNARIVSDPSLPFQGVGQTAANGELWTSRVYRSEWPANASQASTPKQRLPTVNFAMLHDWPPSMITKAQCKPDARASQFLLTTHAR